MQSFPGGAYPPPNPSYPPPPPPAATTPGGADWTTWTTAIGAVMVVVGSLLPWVKATAPFVGTIEVAGTDGDGKITLVLGAVMALGLIRSAGWRVVATLAAVVAAGIALYDISDASDAIDEAERVGEGMVAASVGIGLYVVLAGAVVGFVGAVRAAARSSNS